MIDETSVCRSHTGPDRQADDPAEPGDHDRHRHSAGIANQSFYNWRAQWQKEGRLMPATSKAPHQ